MFAEGLREFLIHLSSTTSVIWSSKLGILGRVARLTKKHAGAHGVPCFFIDIINAVMINSSTISGLTASYRIGVTPRCYAHARRKRIVHSRDDDPVLVQYLEVSIFISGVHLAIPGFKRYPPTMEVRPVALDDSRDRRPEA